MCLCVALFSSARLSRPPVQAPVTLTLRNSGTNQDIQVAAPIHDCINFSWKPEFRVKLLRLLKSRGKILALWQELPGRRPRPRMCTASM